MIKRISIKNFKAHKDTNLNISNLTVFCGANGVGKSSVIHTLLLLREAFLKNSKFEFLNLQSNAVNIGTAKDALYQFSESNEIEFELETTTQLLLFKFEAEKDSDLIKTLIKKSPNINHDFEKTQLEKESLFNRDFQFISAARLGPQTSYKKDDVIVDIYNQISVIEGRAEHFIHFLDKKKNISILKELVNNNFTDDSLLSQTSAWEREITEGVNIVIEDIGNLGYELKYDFNTKSDIGKTNKFQANNVGFGVTYVMPIIVAILASPKNTLLLIENPEAHLHPNGQAKLAELLCLAAEAGIQIIIETHSDHIINGILVNCKKFEENNKGINKDNVSIFHFERDETDHSIMPKKIKIENDGLIIETPRGFFDQFTLDRKFLMGF